MNDPDGPDLPGLDEACEVLADGRPVILPNACPMAYVVVATTPAAINALKRRPIEQPAGINLPRDADWRFLARAIDLPPDDVARMVALMHRELLSFLIPLLHERAYPGWIRPAVKDDHVLLFAGHWAPLARIWDRFPRLFGSSANRSGHPAATTASEAESVFGGEALIVDGDALRDPGCTRGSSTIVRMSPDGRLSLHRRGAQDAVSGLDPEAFVQRLSA